MWARIVNFFFGLWLMAAPALLGYIGTPAEVNDRIVGPLIASFAFVAIWDITRGLRWVNTLLGLWLVVSPFLLGAWVADWSFPATINSVLVGLYVAILSLVPGQVRHQFAGGWRSLLEFHRDGPRRPSVEVRPTEHEWVATEPRR